jgi:hypothetical protein
MPLRSRLPPPERDERQLAAGASETNGNGARWDSLPSLSGAVL